MSTVNNRNGWELRHRDLRNTNQVFRIRCAGLRLWCNLMTHPVNRTTKIGLQKLAPSAGLEPATVRLENARSSPIELRGREMVHRAGVEPATS